MGKHWVKAKTILYISNDAGALIKYNPGDWLEVRNQTLRQLLATDQIELPRNNAMHEAFSLDDTQIIITAGGGDVSLMLRQSGLDGVDVSYSDTPALMNSRNLIIDTSARIRPDLIPIGFHRLDCGWQLAIPIWKYQVLARDVGTDEEREYTRGIIRDLRVMCYDTRVIFARRCPDIEHFIDVYNEELHRFSEDKLSLLRALYITKPVICALPLTWVM